MTLATIARAAACGALLFLGASAQAAGFPDHPITIVVPYTAGGSSDALALLLGKQLADQFSQAVVVEDKHGAGDPHGIGNKE